MTPVRTAAEDYLAIRRALGFKLVTQGRVLMDFVDHLERVGLATVTTEAAIEWATKPSGASTLWHAMRLGVARRFAVHLHLLDPRCEVPPRDVLPERHRRLPPHIYSADDIAALMAEARRLRPPFRAGTAETVIGLFAVTGMRAGEVVRLNRADVDLAAGTLRVIATKFNKSRELALHATTVAALRAYAELARRPLAERGLARLLSVHERQPAESKRAQRHLRRLGARRRAGTGTNVEGAPAAAPRSSPHLRGHHFDRLVSS